MTTQQFLDLNPCVDGKLYALKFPTIKEAWLACNDINNIYWLINEAVKDYSLKKSLYLVFAEECAGRALTYASYASAYAADAAAYAAAYAAYAAAYAADAAADSADAADAAADSADAAAYAADSADAAAYAAYAEREIQKERLKELFTNVIFTE